MGGGGLSGPSPTVKYHYFHRFFTYSVRRNACAERLRRRLSRCSRAKRVRVALRACARTASAVLADARDARPFASRFTVRRHMLPRDPIRGHCQAGSLTGAVHLSKNNAGVLRPAQRGQKPRVEQKGKSWLDPGVQYAQGLRKHGLSILLA